MKNKIITLTALLTVILKELRIERNLGQGWFGDKIGKTPSAVSKLESGDSKLNMDTFFSICAALGITGYNIITCTERHIVMLASNGWQVFNEFPTEETKVDFYKLMEVYFSEPRTIGLTKLSIISSPAFSRPLEVAPVIKYLLSIQ